MDKICQSTKDENFPTILLYYFKKARKKNIVISIDTCGCKKREQGRRGRKEKKDNKTLDTFTEYLFAIILFFLSPSLIS